MTPTVTAQDREQLKATRGRLYQRCRKRGITHEHIRERAKCTRPSVVQWFQAKLLGRGIVGIRIEQAVKDLLAEAVAEKVSA